MYSEEAIVLSSSVLQGRVRQAEAVRQGSNGGVFRIVQLRFLRRPFRSNALGLRRAVYLANSSVVRRLLVVMVCLVSVRFQLLSSYGRRYVLCRDRYAGTRGIRFRGSGLLGHYRGGLHYSYSIYYPQGQCVLVGQLLASRGANDVRKTISQ